MSAICGGGGCKRPEPNENDLEKSWRQTVRWLVADVPRRVEVDVEPQPGSETGAVSISVRVRDPEYLPLDNAQVAIEVDTPDGKTLALTGEPNEGEAGTYVARHVPRVAGAYRAAVTVAAPDGSRSRRTRGRLGGASPSPMNSASCGRTARGWRKLPPRRAAKSSTSPGCPTLWRRLPSRKVPITEPWVRPLWHHPLF